MSKKYKYYLVALHKWSGENYFYSRGEAFDSDYIEGLALVKIDEEKNLDFKGNWAIIDVASGLFVVSSKSKKKTLERYEELKKIRELKEAITNSRNDDTYKRKRIPDMEIKKQNWRASGYEVE